MNFNSPRGTADVLGPDILYRDYIIDTAKKLFQLYSYKEIITPIFEHTEVFTRGIGQYSDIVSKEMYTFQDKKGRSITLRPEGTAPVVRAFIENKLYAQNLPAKLFYIGHMFRYERPQKGRMREFSQLGIEAIGSNDAVTDVEAIWLLNQLFLDLGFKNLRLLVNSIGCLECRKEFLKILEDYLEKIKNGLCSDCNERFGKNTLRIYDCKVEGCKEILKDAPKIEEYVCQTCKVHFARVTGILDRLDIKYEIAQSLVRGFDYYTRTIFEIISKDIDSAQNALGGGGRYDNLVKQFGGPDLPSVGFAIGIERTYMLMKELNIDIKCIKSPKKIYFIRLDDKHDAYLFHILKFFRNKNYICDFNINIKNMSTEIKKAKSSGFDFAVIIGDQEAEDNTITIKNIETFHQDVFRFAEEADKIIEFVEYK